ncbi:MAG: family 20 glycosylhydrolase [Lachnospiraceae bacterium]
MGKNKRNYAVFLGICVLITAAAAGGLFLWRGRPFNSANLALRKGVIATSDSVENEELSAYRAIDGDDVTLSSRWSSENNWEDASHYIQLEFPEEISVSFVILKWERRNAVSYALEGSADGKTWEVLQSFDTAPQMKHQEIALEDPAVVRFLRLSTYEVSKNEADYSNLYQNISLYEFEVYADKPAAYQLEEARIEEQEDGGRRLVVPKAPEGYEVTYLGADLEQVIGPDGLVYDTIQDKEVTVGFRVSSRKDASDVRETAQILTVPANQREEREEKETQKALEKGPAEEADGNVCPDVIPALAEWSGGSGSFVPADQLRVLVETGSGFRETAVLFADSYAAATGHFVEVTEGSLDDVQAGEFYLGYAEETEGLGQEGYTCEITDKCVIRAETNTGIRWGCVTIWQILQQEGSVPQGRIRDYPRYVVRGFGIDVARKAVSLDTLYAMMETMSYYKMNDLTIHLNDNVILSTSGLTDSVEQAMTADSAFRLESEITNQDGRRLTSSEYAYTKEEFAEFIRTARLYGVTVVPEIDTPAHSLAITQLFPEYALTARAESVDQIDLSNRDAVELVKKIWTEALSGDEAAFRDAEIVNIGMDEYYGDGEQYRKYLKEIAQLVQDEGRTVRLWGSLSNMAGSTVPDPDDLQMNIWSTVWADPQEMYALGYSLINMQNNHLYVIPGGGYDYLDVEELYRNWEPNQFYDYNLLEKIPAYSPQMLGAVYMMWNDMCGRLDVGISEYDLYDRFRQPLPVLAAKLWDGEPGISYEAFVAQADGLKESVNGILTAAGKSDSLFVGLVPSYEVKIRVKLSGSGEETTKGQIIAESDSAYGVWAFYAVEPETGCVGFAREGRTYAWNYRLLRDQWVELKVVGEPGRTTLYADGVPVGTLGNEKAFEEYATFVFPMQRIGIQTGDFDGEMEIVTTSTERKSFRPEERSSRK